MDGFDELLDANARFAASFTSGDLSPEPRRHLAIVTCMDCRVDPALFLRLGLGDAHVIRNAGGRVTEDVLRSLTISVGLLGVTAVAVIRHTGCGLQGRSWDVRERLGQAGVSATGLELHTFTDLEESVREDVVALRHSPALRDRVDVRGFVYRVADGVLAPVDTP